MTLTHITLQKKVHEIKCLHLRVPPGNYKMVCVARVQMVYDCLIWLSSIFFLFSIMENCKHTQKQKEEYNESLRTHHSFLAMPTGLPLERFRGSHNWHLLDLESEQAKLVIIGLIQPALCIWLPAWIGKMCVFGTFFKCWCKIEMEKK